MRDDSAKWSADRGTQRPPVRTGGVQICLLQPHRQTLISGPHTAALALAGCSAATGWPAPASGETYALRLRRDRILVVNGSDLTDGWHADPGLAVSDMTGGYAVIALSGDGATDLLNTGTELDPAQPSASVARLLHGYPVLLYRFQGETTDYRLHVPRASLEGLWSLLEELAKA